MITPIYIIFNCFKMQDYYKESIISLKERINGIKKILKRKLILLNVCQQFYLQALTYKFK